LQTLLSLQKQNLCRQHELAATPAGAIAVVHDFAACNRHGFFDTLASNRVWIPANSY
jgi:hypothetical protein